MPASLHKWALPGVRVVTARKWLMGGVVSIALLGGAALVARLIADGSAVGRPMPAELAALPSSMSTRLELEQCVKHAFLLYDVHWAASCTVVAEQDQAKHAACLNDRAIMADPQRGKDYCDKTFALRDATIECDLPGPQAASVNALLNEEEQKCYAEAKAARTP